MKRSCFTALVVVLVTASHGSAIEAFGPGFHRGAGYFPAEFDVVLDVNGETFDVDIPNSRGRLHATIINGDELLDLGFDQRCGGCQPRWLSDSVVEFDEVIDGARVRTTIYPIRRRFSMDMGRLYTRTRIDFNSDWDLEPRTQFFNLFHGFNVPATADSLTRLDKTHWEISGVYGPRIDSPFSLYSGVVGGRQFDVTIREMGFGHWEAGVLTNMPEPSTYALLLVSGVAAVLSRRRLVYRSS